jgi:hypothetical protein
LEALEYGKTFRQSDESLEQMMAARIINLLVNRVNSK